MANPCQSHDALMQRTAFELVFGRPSQLEDCINCLSPTGFGARLAAQGKSDTLAPGSHSDQDVDNESDGLCG